MHRLHELRGAAELYTSSTRPTLVAIECNHGRAGAKWVSDWHTNHSYRRAWTLKADNLYRSTTAGEQPWIRDGEKWCCDSSADYNMGNMGGRRAREKNPDPGPDGQAVRRAAVGVRRGRR